MEQKGDKFIPKLSQPDPFGSINATFGIENPVTVIEPLREYPVVDSSEYPITTKEREDDFSTIRQTLHRIMQKAEDSLDSLTIIAKSSESARGFEVVSTMIGVVSDTASKIIDLHDKKAKMDLGNTGTPIGNIEQQNNIVFTGSSAELLKAIKANREKVINV